jgi:hypothetical protein
MPSHYSRNLPKKKSRSSHKSSHGKHGPIKVKKDGSAHKVVSGRGRVLGVHSSKSEATKQMQAINIRKYGKAGSRS